MATNRESMPRRADSRDVAARAGVSRSTVSKVLNGREANRIPAATRQRVLQAARELNYVRNNRAHALVTGRTGRIGVVLNHPALFASTAQGDYHRAVLSGIFDGAVACDYNLLFHSARYSHWRVLYDDIVGGSADGVLIIGNYPVVEFEEALVESGFPVVFTSHAPKAQPHYAVDCDNVHGGYLAGQYLVSLGHRHIAYVIQDADSHEVDWVNDRLLGLQKALSEAEQTGTAAHCSIIPTTTAEALVATLHAMPSRPTAIFQPNDDNSARVITLLQQEGIRVPDDISLMNFNSTESCEKAPVRITSIWQPLREIGERALFR